jgi:hypothetical protein
MQTAVLNYNYYLPEIQISLIQRKGLGEESEDNVRFHAGMSEENRIIYIKDLSNGTTICQCQC